MNEAFSPSVRWPVFFEVVWGTSPPVGPLIIVALTAVLPGIQTAIIKHLALPISLPSRTRLQIIRVRQYYYISLACCSPTLRSALRLLCHLGQRRFDCMNEHGRAGRADDVAIIYQRAPVRGSLSFITQRFIYQQDLSAGVHLQRQQR